MAKREVDCVVILGAGASGIALMQNIYHRGPGWAGTGKVETWALNSAAFGYRCDLSFNMHDLAQERFAFIKDWYAGWTQPVVTCRAIPELPWTVEYPLAEIMEEFGDPYLMNTTTYALVAAAWCGAKRVFLFGTDFNYEGASAYEHGRANLEYWIGKLVERGVSIQVPHTTMLLDAAKRQAAGVYGYGAAQPQWETDGERVRLRGFAEIGGAEAPDT